MVHAHSHHQAPKTYTRAFQIGIGLNIGFVLIEAGFGWVTQSLALLADAGHNLSDVLGLLLAWEALRRRQAPPPVPGLTLIWVAGVGVVINTLTALLFFSGGKGDLNIRGPFCIWSPMP